jgi:hypothetical protein
MGDVPTTVDQPAKSVEEIIHGIIFDLAVAAGLKAIKAVPWLAWLNWPIISPCFDFFVKWIAGYIYRPLAQTGALTTIALQTQQERDTYAAAEAALRAAHLSGDPKALQAASDAFNVAAAGLVHWDGSAPL